MKKIGLLMYWGPYKAGSFGQMGVLANRPKLDQCWLLTSFSCTISNCKGGNVYKMQKFAISFKKGPMCLAVLFKGMAADRPKMGRSIFFNDIEFKFQNEYT